MPTVRTRVHSTDNAGGLDAAAAAAADDDDYVINLDDVMLVDPYPYIRYLCIRSVFILTSECTSLTVTLVLTLRKFLSLIISIVYFDNAFTLSHWLGTALIFTGTLLFADVFSSIIDKLTHRDDKVTNSKALKTE